MKNINEYLVIKCPLWDDVTEAECKEFGVDIKNFDCKFLHFELKDNGRVVYTYQCDICGTTHELEHVTGIDFVYLGECPSDEDPFRRYTTRQTCSALVKQLRNTFGKEPDGARLAIRYEAGADGYTVVCAFDMAYPMSYAYAMQLEGNFPEKWSPAAIKTLENLTGKPYHEKWVKFWFESNVVWGYVSSHVEWEHFKKVLRDNDYESDPLDCKSCKTAGNTPRFGYCAEYTEEYTLRNFFRDNNMTN